MKRATITLLCAMILPLVADLASAQRDDRPRQKRKAQDRQQGDRQGGRRQGRPTHPLLALLDADRDGKLSAKEIANAVAVLKKLDRNQDGALTARELPRPQVAGRRMPGGRAGRARGGDGRGSTQFVERIMALDKNKDGKITKDELPEARQRLFELADSDSDGALDKAEIEKIGRGRAGRAAGRGGRRAAGDRPDRPQRPNPSR